MALFERALLLVVAVPLVLLVIGCGVSSGAPPSSGQEVLDRMLEAMAEVESYRFTGILTSEGGNPDGTTNSFRATLDGTHGPNESWYVNAEMTSNVLDGVEEWVAVDGVVMTRLSRPEPERWVESSLMLTGRPLYAPSIEIAQRTNVEGWDADAQIDGRKAHLVSGKHQWREFVGPLLGDVEFYIEPETFRLLAMSTRVEGKPDEGRFTMTTEYTFSDFGGDVQIELPTDFKPAQYADYVFEIDGAIDEDSLRGNLNLQLSRDLDLAGFSIRVADGRVTIRLIDYTYPPERVGEVVNEADLEVKVTLVDYRPPRGPHHQSAPHPTPTPTKTATPGAA